MSAVSSIEWTDRTWNPVTGCSKVSPGCAHCYAEGVAMRFWASQYPAIPTGSGLHADGERPRQFTDVMTHKERLAEPLSWRKPARVFVNSMSDLFHEDVPDAFIDQVFAIMVIAERHTFQILTKRPSRMRDWFAAMSRHETDWSRRLCAGVPNIWLGVSVENQHFADERIPLLLQTPAAVRFISAEPLLEAVDLGLSKAVCGCCERIFSSRWVRTNRRLEADFPMNIVGDYAGKSVDPGVHRADSNRHGALSVNGIGIRPSEFDTLPALDWVIVGGESGPGARPFDVSWARSIVQQCKTAGVPVFVKQLGAQVITRNDDGWEGDTPRSWPMDTICEENIHGFREEYQGAPVRVRLHSRKGGDMAEWPDDLRIRQFPEAV